MSIEDIYGQEYSEEDMNNFSKLREASYDFNLMRKHELAETDDNRMVYRQKDGKIVDWTQAATEQAEGVKNDCLVIKDDITAYANQIEEQINSVLEQATEQQEEVEQLIEEVEDMIDLEKITDEEIDIIVEGGE